MVENHGNMLKNAETWWFHPMVRCKTKNCGLCMCVFYVFLEEIKTLWEYGLRATFFSNLATHLQTVTSGVTTPGTDDSSARFAAVKSEVQRGYSEGSTT